MGYQWRWRRGPGPGRPMKPRTIGGRPDIMKFNPVIPPSKVNEYKKDPIVMTQDEWETIRLIDYEGLLQEEAAQRMGISRGTVWRCLDSARRKIATMLAEGRELVINP